MAKNSVADWDTTAANNSDIAGITLGEGVMQMSMINDAIRTMMAQIAGAGFITGTTTVFADDAFALADNADATKKLAFQLSGITTGTTRTLTVPDASGTIALLSNLSSYMATASYPTLTGLEGLSLVSGDILYAAAADTLARLPKGSDAQVLTLASGVPGWSTLPSAPATGQPIPTSSTYAVGTFLQARNSTGSTMSDGASVAGSGLFRLAGNTAQTTTALTGTWKCIWGASVASANDGLFVRVS